MKLSELTNNWQKNKLTSQLTTTTNKYQDTIKNAPQILKQ